MSRKYPVPIRFHWKVMIEFNDGSVIYGASDDDLVERWGRILGWGTLRPLRPNETRDMVVRYLVNFYQADFNGSSGWTSNNTEFLEAIEATGHVKLIRK